MKTEETLLELVKECPVTVVKESVPDDKGEAKLARVKQLKELGFTGLAEDLEKHLVNVKLKKLAEFRYIRIGNEMITSFLQRKVDRYNREHKPKVRENNFDPAPNEATIYPIQRMSSQSLEPNSSGRAILLQRQMQEYRQTLAASMRQQQLAAQSNQNPWGNGIANALMRAAPMTGLIGAINAMYSKLSVKTCDYHSSDPNSIGQYAWTEVDVKDWKGVTLNSTPPKNVIDDMQEHKEREVFDCFTVASVKGIHDPLLLGRITGVEDRFFISQWADDICLDDLI